jgi:hypothetical protein
MAYVDNKTITVDAVLTKRGRELLAQTGNLNITSFALADDEIDYSLYNPNHPQGSAYYDIAIRNTPVFQPLSDETQSLKYKLITLAQGVVSIPVISVSLASIDTQKDNKSDFIISPSTNPAYNLTLGYTAILGNKKVGTLIVDQTNSVNSSTSTVPSFAGDLISTTSQVVVGNRFRFVPNTSLTTTTSTTITIVGNESGGSVSIPVTVRIS